MVPSMFSIEGALSHLAQPPLKLYKNTFNSYWIFGDTPTFLISIVFLRIYAHYNREPCFFIHPVYTQCCTISHNPCVHKVISTCLSYHCANRMMLLCDCRCIMLLLQCPIIQYHQWMSEHLLLLAATFTHQLEICSWWNYF